MWRKALQEQQYQYGYQLNSGMVMRYFYLIVLPIIGVYLLGAFIYFVAAHPGNPPDPTKAPEDLEQQPLIHGKRKRQRKFLQGEE